MREKIVLSDRLKSLAVMVSVGNRVCDVGCDHAFVPIYLINHSISPYVLAMDVKKGPIESAKEHIREYGLEDYIETRLSDGLTGFKTGEADSLICAGMGGRLMMSILDRDKTKTDSFKEMILQPQSEIEQFRYFLRSNGYLIVEENMIEEGGKFYPIIKVINEGNTHKTLTIGDSLRGSWQQQMEDRYGPFLIRNNNPVLVRYLKWETGVYEEVLSQLKVQDMSKGKIQKRYDEVKVKLDDCLKVLSIISQSCDNV
ncbi:MAG: class I SAM-dependent methyltransferase [Lachnospiraceae bacterium]|nr:class I SAM-dependent methyltransferase [Lachnospiraceae bacterium]